MTRSTTTFTNTPVLTGMSRPESDSQVCALMPSGSVSLYAKALGFHVVCSELALRSAAIGRALIANTAVKLTQVHVTAFLREPRQDFLRVAEKEFCPAVFPREHARLVDRALHWLRMGEIPDPKHSLLILLLVLS